MSDVPERLNAALEGRYRVERQRGEGGMATVYLADDLRHERKVALKVLKPDFTTVIGDERPPTAACVVSNVGHRQNPIFRTTNFQRSVGGDRGDLSFPDHSGRRVT